MYDQRYGNFYLIHSPDTKGLQTFPPPIFGRGKDWSTIVEDAAPGSLARRPARSTRLPPPTEKRSTLSFVVDRAAVQPLG